MYFGKKGNSWQGNLPLEFSVKLELKKPINLLTPNVNYSGHTATLTSKVAFYIFIQQI